MKCPHCNDTGKITLLTSIVDCDCQSGFYIECSIGEGKPTRHTTLDSLVSWLQGRAITAVFTGKRQTLAENPLIRYEVTWIFSSTRESQGLIESNAPVEDQIWENFHEAFKKGN